MKKIIGYTKDGVATTYNSIFEAAKSMGCDESSIRRAIRKGNNSVKGITFKLIDNSQQGNEEQKSKLPREIDEELKRLGVNIEDVGTVWAKQMKNGSYRYSIKFDEKEKGDSAKLLEAFKQHATDNIRMYFGTTPAPGDKSLMVYTSDKHIGAMTNNNSMFSNDYNSDVFHNRMMELLHKIVALSKENKVFDNLYIIDLGDPLDGLNQQTTRGGHSLPQNMSNEEAFESFIKTHILFFDSLVELKVANKIHFKAVTNDNHAGSFGYTAQRALEIYLNARYPKIETEINDQFMFHFFIGKHVFIVTHGKDKTDRMRPLPLNLNDQTKNFIADYIDYHQISRSPGYLHVVKGDMHQAASQLTGRFRYRNVLSLYGASAWIHNNFGSQTIAGVAMDIIEENNNNIMETNLIFN